MCVHVTIQACVHSHIQVNVHVIDRYVYMYACIHGMCISVRVCLSVYVLGVCLYIPVVTRISEVGNEYCLGRLR